MMEHLAVGNGVIAVVLKVLGQADDAGEILVGIGVVIEKTVFARPNAGQHARPGSAADRDVTIGPIEQHAPCREPVYIRRLNKRVTVATQLRPQIVDKDQEDIGGGSFTIPETLITGEKQ